MEKLYYDIYEVTELLGFENDSKVRHYMKYFNITIPKRAGKYPFREKDIEKIRKISTLTEEEGYNLKGAKNKLRKKEVHDESKQEILMKLQNIKRILLLLKDNMPN